MAASAGGTAGLQPSPHRPRRQRRAAGPAQERALDRGFVGLAGADAHHVLDRGDEDLAVADLAGARRLDDRVDRALDLAVGHHHLDFHLGQEIDYVLGAAVQLVVTFLPVIYLPFFDSLSAVPNLPEILIQLVRLASI